MIKAAERSLILMAALNYTIIGGQESVNKYKHTHQASSER